MKIRRLAVGQRPPAWVQEGYSDYVRRLPRDLPMELTEIAAPGRRGGNVDQARAAQPDIHVITHPECRYEVCQKADSTGSTERIIQAIENARPGTHWAVGTEVHLVNRLAIDAKKRGVHVRMLSDCQCLCTTMYRIDMPHLLSVLDNLADGKVINRIEVHPEARKWALIALQRMLDITAAGKRRTQTAKI